MADRINNHDRTPLFRGVGAQFEDNPKRHADPNPQHVNNYLHKAPQSDEAKGKKANANEAARKAEFRSHNDGFDRIDRNKVGNHKVSIQEVLENAHPMKRWRQDDHTSPWNDIEQFRKPEQQESNAAVACPGDELASSTDTHE